MKIRSLCCITILGASYLVTQCHIQEEWMPPLHHSEKPYSSQLKHSFFFVHFRFRRLSTCFCYNGLLSGWDVPSCVERDAGWTWVFIHPCSCEECSYTSGPAEDESTCRVLYWHVAGNGIRILP